MVFNSFQFIWLFPIIFLFYYLISSIRKNHLVHKFSNLFLIIASYLLYAQWNSVYTLLLFGITVITYLGALAVSGKEQSRKKRTLIWILVILTLLPLAIFKYYDFIHFQVGQVLSAFNIANEIPGLNWIIPVGISFYSFQALGYLFDVYYGRITAERNFRDYTLFVCFFPQIMSGPISRASDLLPQIKSERKFDYDQAVSGCRLLLWGYFLKLVFADRLGLAVDTIIPNYQYLSGGTCAFGAIMYSLQIYGDFAGYSLMAVGVGKIMGFNLIQNFNRPYFSASITEFWKRWHISLTKWLTSYVYIPLGGSRCGKLKTYRNIMVTFLVSGIWHGANWTYIFWGAIHGALQIFEKFFGIQKSTGKWIRSLRIPVVFLLVTVLWILFRVPSIGDWVNILAKIITEFGNISISASNSDKLLMGLSIALVFVKEWFNEYRPHVTVMQNRSVIIRWSAYIVLTCMILLCGVLDASSFIYVSF